MSDENKLVVQNLEVHLNSKAEDEPKSTFLAALNSPVGLTAIATIAIGLLGPFLVYLNHKSQLDIEDLKVKNMLLKSVNDANSKGVSTTISTEYLKAVSIGKNEEEVKKWASKLIYYNNVVNANKVLLSYMQVLVRIKTLAIAVIRNNHNKYYDNKIDIVNASSCDHYVNSLLFVLLNAKYNNYGDVETDQIGSPTCSSFKLTNRTKGLLELLKTLDLDKKFKDKPKLDYSIKRVKEAISDAEQVSLNTKPKEDRKKLVKLYKNLIAYSNWLEKILIRHLSIKSYNNAAEKCKKTDYKKTCKTTIDNFKEELNSDIETYILKNPKVKSDELMDFIDLVNLLSKLEVRYKNECLGHKQVINLGDMPDQVQYRRQPQRP